jgi:hypothetical protein
LAGEISFFAGFEIFRQDFGGDLKVGGGTGLTELGYFRWALKGLPVDEELELPHPAITAAASATRRTRRRRVSSLRTDILSR